MTSQSLFLACSLLRYVEAQKARKKYEELRAKEEERQRRLIDQAQQQEMMEVEQAQRAQFLGFSNAWDKYMADYESTAYMSLERLKEQHGEELSKFQEMIRDLAEWDDQFLVLCSSIIYDVFQLRVKK